MKIHQLPLGARFEYEGAEYVKSGPLFATGPGGQRMIPKYAVLRPLDAQAAPAAAATAPTLSRERVLAAFGCFCAAVRPPAGEPSWAEFERAREAFLAALDSGQPR